MEHIEQSYDKNIDLYIVSMKSARKRGKCFINLSNNEHLLIEKDLVYEFQLQKGHQLSREVFDKLMYREALIEAKKKGLSYATYALRSTQQVKKKLSEHGYNTAIIQEVISFLHEFEYLSDELFTNSFIKAKIERKYYGIQRIKRELESKGIHSSIIDKCLSSAYPEEKAWEIARKSAEKKLRSISFREDKKKRIQLQNHLFRQGFPIEVIKQVLNEYC
ncbi:MAG: regulatory protein RecX [Ignavibacteria bacterium]|jgi:regulatory protein